MYEFMHTMHTIQGLIETYVLEGAKLIIVETWGGQVWYGQERDAGVYYALYTITSHELLCVLGYYCKACSNGVICLEGNWNPWEGGAFAPLHPPPPD